MQLYFSPLACSLATRISLYEAGAEATYTEIDPKTKLTRDGKDFREVHPLGLVPTARTDDGELLMENAAILQYVAGRHSHANLAPTDELGRARLQQWLCFIGTELHKGLFAPLLDPKAPEAVKTYALEKGASRLSFVDEHLTGREFLLERFSVADAYLFTVLNWCMATPVDLKKWPALAAYSARLRERPSVAKAFAEERVLYMEELARHKAA
ncbi:glutathione binding-like protein [Cystobacter ferrugineus]|uniref:Glutathione S-transferase n=1 Tax=Cystobacter ferrugineus TaxID=83449 RepID=A0A1L9B3V3_9BACT|nr:glutathione binding-like protein [Cystobacter ferrugineus]OJH36924.1 glutathione S-transferase [Cystobacter ferrugineus]